MNATAQQRLPSFLTSSVKLSKDDSQSHVQGALDSLLHSGVAGGNEERERATQHSDNGASPHLHATNNLSQTQRIAMLPRKATRNTTAKRTMFVFSSATIISCRLFYRNKLKRPSNSALVRPRRLPPKPPGPRYVTCRFPNVYGTPGRLRVFIGHADEPQVICLFSCDVAVNFDCVTLQKLGTVVEADSFVIF